jgi:hypothetical protein
LSSADLQKYTDIEEELERMRAKSEAAEKELAEIRGRSNDKATVPAKAGGADDGERERMRLLMRAEKVACECASLAFTTHILYSFSGRIALQSCG